MINQMTNTQLLQVLVGSAAKSLSKHSLAELFGLKAMRQTVNRVAEDILAYAVPDKLLAARELLKRALEESMGDSTINMNSPQAVKDYLRLFFGGCQEERFVALWLDSQNRLISGMELFRGTLSQASVYPREVVKIGLQFNASSVILVHNHPSSGSSEPSSADRSLTKHLKEALGLVDIRVLDHMIVGDESVMSFAERGLI